MNAKLSVFDYWKKDMPSDLMARCNVHLNYSDTIAALANPDQRLKLIKGDRPGFFGDYEQLEILYDGKWRSVFRTDLKDDVCTGLSWTSDKTFYEDRLGYYRERVAYGARIGDDWFAVIDSMSDG